jgi:hypothetical protein
MLNRQIVVSAEVRKSSKPKTDCASGSAQNLAPTRTEAAHVVQEVSSTEGQSPEVVWTMQ